MRTTSIRPITALATLTLLVAPVAGARAAAPSTSLAFFVNAANDHDYGMHSAIPAGFGDGEFTLELWIQPDDSFPVGSTGGSGQLTNWSDADIEPYSTGSWWFEGNFLLDGHNNNSFGNGTFSLQFYGGGRLRWLFGDGDCSCAGGHWSVGAFPATDTPSLLDGQWHQVTLVRRWSGMSEAQLELWIDGSLVATQTSFNRADMRSWWDDWSSFPANQEGWFWGAEKQAAIGLLSQYEDYKGPIDELRFFSRAKSTVEITTGWNQPVAGNEPGLVGLYRFDEGAGTQACDQLSPADCMDLFRMKPGHWSSDTPPLGAEIFSDGFESGATASWSSVTP